MADDKVTLEIEVSSKEAARAIEKFARDTEKSLSKTEDSFKDLSKALDDLPFADKLLGPLGKVKDSFAKVTTSVGSLSPAMLGVGASVGVAGAAFFALGKGIGEALEEEANLKRLSLALRSTGENSTEAVNKIRDFADALSDLTGVDDDAIIGAVTLAKSFGITNDQAEKLAKAAVNLSSVTGDDLETSVRQLGGTMDGTIGKVGNLGQEFRDLTEDQLRAGAAVDLVNKKLNDAGKELGDTLPGSFNKLKNATNDFLKSFGQIATGDNFITRTFKLLTDDATAFIKAITPAAKVTESVFVPGLEKTAKVSQKTAEQVKKLAESADKLRESIKESFGSNVEKDAAKIAKTIQEINKLEKEGGIGFKEATELRTKVIDDFNKKRRDEEKKTLEDIEKLEEKSAKESLERQKKLREDIQKITQDPFAAFEEGNTASTGQKVGAAVAAGFNSALKGRQGAVDLLSKGVGAAMEAAFPGFGQAAAEAFRLLSGGKEQAKAFVTEFIDSVPEIIEAVGEALPDVIVRLIEKIFSVEFATKFGVASAHAFISIATGGSFGEQAGQKIANAFNAPVQRLIDFFNNLDLTQKVSGKGIGNVGGGGAVGTLARIQAVASTGGLSEVASFFAKGGPVYAAGGFVPRGTDTVPAMLTPGELVVPKDTHQQLASFLENEKSSGAPSLSDAILTQILAALSQPQTAKASVEFNQSVLADIMLQLNRNNARTAA